MKTISELMIESVCAGNHAYNLDEIINVLNVDAKDNSVRNAISSIMGCFYEAFNNAKNERDEDLIIDKYESKLKTQAELEEIFKDPIFDNCEPNNLTDVCNILNDNMKCNIVNDEPFVKSLVLSVGADYVGNDFLIASIGITHLCYDAMNKEYYINAAII